MRFVAGWFLIFLATVAFWFFLVGIIIHVVRAP